MRVVNREVGAISFFCFFLDVNPRSATEWSGAGREAASPTAASTLRLLHPRRARFFLLKAFSFPGFFLRRPFRPRGARFPSMIGGRSRSSNHC